VSQYVVIGTAPCNDTSVAIGPFRTEAKASQAWDQLTHLGYNAETCLLMSLNDVGPAHDYDGADE